MKRLLFYFNVPILNTGLMLRWSGILFACYLSLIISSCKKDLVDTGSNLSNEFSVKLPQEIITLIRGVKGGDSIKAQIIIPGQPGDQFDTSAYTYLWVNANNKDTLSTKHYLTYKDFENQVPTLISCVLTVKEKRTGITKHAVSGVFLTTATREGWVLLGDQAGSTKLSMLTYTANGYKKYIDLKSELGINVPINGKPVSIDALGTEIVWNLGKYQWLGITTDQEVKFIQTTDLAVDQKISDYLTETLQPGPGHQVILAVNGQTTFVATKDNNVYSFNTFKMSYWGSLSYDKISSYPPGLPNAESFKASPIHSFTGPLPLTEYSRLMYDEDKCQFVRAHLSGNPNINGVFPLQLPFSLQGFQLKAMSTKMESDNDEVTAFLHNSVKHESYLIQFLSNGIMKSVKNVAAADANEIVQSRSIEIDHNTGYLIYTKGSEVKAYDYKMGQTLSLLNLGNEEITLLKMTKHIPSSSKMSGRVDIYKQLLKRLIVCTFDSSKPNNGGTFRLFQIPLGHQALVKETEETGFPKIVDVTFAPIP